MHSQMVRRCVCLVIAVLLPLSVAEGQDPKEEDVIKIDTQLIDVPVAVTTANGTPVKGLKASNFVVFEDGKRQEVVDFSTTAEPFEVALLLDTSGSARSELALIQRAALDFVSSLRPGDRVAVIAFRTERKAGAAFSVPQVLAPLTDDRALLKKAVENVTISNGTPYYDALLKVSESVFAAKPAEEFRGRRALVALTDGVDSTSAHDFGIAKEQLQAMGVISFFIKVDTREFFEENLLGDCESAIRFSTAQIRRYYKAVSGPNKASMEKAVNFCGLGDFERLAVSKKLYEIADAEMLEMAKISGGKVVPIGDLSEARNAFRVIADEIGTKYTLGYYSSNEKRDGTFRRIRVELKGVPAGAIVRAREGYTAPVK